MAERYKERRLNSPNEVAIGPGDSVYFTDPTFGIDGYGPEKAQSEQPVKGIYRLRSGGQLELMSGGLTQPNGIAFSNSRNTAYVSDTATGAIHAFAVEPGGKFARQRKFASLDIDGLKVDLKVRVWVAGPKSITVLSPSGEPACTLETGIEHVANLALGGRSGREVLITGSNSVFLLDTTEVVSPPR